jgi:hypothetical protein
MAERHYVAVYWEDRAATKPECTGLVLQTLAKLRDADPLFARWFLKRSSREKSLESELTESSQQALLEEGLVLVADDSPGLGWRVTVWNGLGEGESAHADLVVGAAPRILFNPTPNSVTLQMPRGREQLLRRGAMTALLSELARVWRADWGIASTDGYLYGVLPTRPTHHPRVGWLTFLNARRGRAPKLPKAHVTQVEGIGYVVATQDDEFSSGDPSAIQRVRQLEDALEAAKRLRPAGEIPVVPDDAEEADAPTPAGDGAYTAALDAATAVDALAAHLPARRADLAETLLRASTALVVAVATKDEPGRILAEIRALLDVAERLVPGAGVADRDRAREALERVEG